MQSGVLSAVSVKLRYSPLEGWVGPSGAHLFVRPGIANSPGTMFFSALIAEDDDVTRQGLCFLLEERLGSRVVATTEDYERIVPLLDLHGPDLLILDLELPDLNGPALLQTIRSQALSVRVLAFSVYRGNPHVVDALRLGAAGYVVKGAALDEVEEAVQTIMSGKTYLSEEISEDLIEENGLDIGLDPYKTLTDREREVLQLTARGRTSREVGSRLHISHRKVEKHTESILEKLDLRNTVELAAYVHERGLLAESADG